MKNTIEDINEILEDVSRNIFTGEWKNDIALFEEDEEKYLKKNDGSNTSVNLSFMRKFLVHFRNLCRIKDRLEYYYKHWDKVSIEMGAEVWNDGKGNVTEKRKRVELETIEVQKVREAIRYYFSRLSSMVDASKMYNMALHKEINSNSNLFE